MEIGVYSFAEISPDPMTGKTVSAGQSLRDLIEQIRLADDVGLDIFGVGEHHRPDFAISCPSTVLAAAASQTKQIRLTSAATILATEDPIRVFEQFSTLDLLSAGRAEIMIGRGAYIESFRLFGKDLSGYETLFNNNLRTLLELNGASKGEWADGYSTPAAGNGYVYPRPEREIPIWYATSGSPQSAVHAGKLGLPIALAIANSQPCDFKSFIQRYRQAGQDAGFPSSSLSVNVNCHGFVGTSEAEATEAFFPYYAASVNRSRRGRDGDDFTMSEFDHSTRLANHLIFGTPEQVVEKILYQHELFGHDRLLMQISAGSVPHRSVMRSIELLGTKVAPSVRSALRQHREMRYPETLAMQAV